MNDETRPVPPEPTPNQQPHCGWGSCSSSGCPCRHYQQSYGNDLCANCGHNYSAHW